MNITETFRFELPTTQQHFGRQGVKNGYGFFPPPPS